MRLQTLHAESKFERRQQPLGANGGPVVLDSGIALFQLRTTSRGFISDEVRPNQRFLSSPSFPMGQPLIILLDHETQFFWEHCPGHR